MIFLAESIVTCAVFSLFVYLISRDPVKIVYNYPPAIIDRSRSLGLVDDSNKRGGMAFYVKKVTAMALFGVLLGLLVRYVNGCTTFWGGALTAYALWNVVNWFDALEWMYAHAGEGNRHRQGEDCRGWREPGKDKSKEARRKLLGAFKRLVK